MSQHAFYMGDLDLCAEPFHALGEGWDLGNGTPLLETVQGWLRDGARVAEQGWENRTLTFDVEIRAADSVELAAADAALAAAMKADTVTWTEPDGLTTTVFDVQHAWMQQIYSDLDALRKVKRWRVTAQALPFGRSVDMVVDVAEPVVQIPTVLDDGSATTNWTALDDPASSRRENRILNPTFESGVARWASAQANLSQITGGAFDTYGMRLTATAPSAMSAFLDLGVVAGESYSASVYVRHEGTARACNVSIVWYSTLSGGGSLSTSSGTASNDGPTYSRRSVVATAPAGAIRARMFVNFSGVGIGETHVIDAAMFEQASSLDNYFDGSSTPPLGRTNVWTGTPQDSSSVQTWSSSAAVTLSTTSGKVRVTKSSGVSRAIGLERSGLTVPQRFVAVDCFASVGATASFSWVQGASVAPAQVIATALSPSGTTRHFLAAPPFAGSVALRAYAHRTAGSTFAAGNYFEIEEVDAYDTMPMIGRQRLQLLSRPGSAPGPASLIVTAATGSSLGTVLMATCPEGSAFISLSAYMPGGTIDATSVSGRSWSTSPAAGASAPVNVVPPGTYRVLIQAKATASGEHAVSYNSGTGTVTTTINLTAADTYEVLSLASVPWPGSLRRPGSAGGASFVISSATLTVGEVWLIHESAEVTWVNAGSGSELVYDLPSVDLPRGGVWVDGGWPSGLVQRGEHYLNAGGMQVWVATTGSAAATLSSGGYPYWLGSALL